MEERWITEDKISTFINALSNLADTNNKKVELYLFGGSALILHGLREATSDFDSIMLVNGEINQNFFNTVKPTCLKSIGLKPSEPLFNETFNDLSVLPIDAQKRGFEHLQKNYEKCEFESKKFGNLNIKIPSKKYLLTSRLFDLMTENPKTQLDIIDAKKLIKDLNINKANKNEFLENINHPRKEEISNILKNTLDIIESTEKASSHINKVREKLLENIPLRNINKLG